MFCCWVGLKIFRRSNFNILKGDFHPSGSIDIPDPIQLNDKKGNCYNYHIYEKIFKLRLKFKDTIKVTGISISQCKIL